MFSKALWRTLWFFYGEQNSGRTLLWFPKIWGYFGQSHFIFIGIVYLSLQQLFSAERRARQWGPSGGQNRLGCCTMGAQPGESNRQELDNHIHPFPSLSNSKIVYVH